MYNIRSKQDLEEAILLIENEVDVQQALLNDQVRLVYESYSPVNVVKNVVREAVVSEELRGNIITAIIGISTGYLTKRIFFGKNTNPLKSLLGTVLQYGVANLIINPSRFLKTILAPFQEFFDSKEDKKPSKKKKSRR